MKLLALGAALALSGCLAYPKLDLSAPVPEVPLDATVYVQVMAPASAELSSLHWGGAADLAHVLESAGIRVEVVGTGAELPGDAVVIDGYEVNPSCDHRSLYIVPATIGGLTYGIVPALTCRRLGYRFSGRRGAREFRVDTARTIPAVFGSLAPLLNLSPSWTSDLPSEEIRAFEGRRLRSVLAAAVGE